MANIDLIVEVAKALGDLLDQVVFVGGTAVALIIEDPAAPETRPTDDVDVISAVTTYDDYRDLTALLEARGFKEGGPGEPICRWKVAGVLVDIMPQAEGVLGFASRWYPEVFATALTREVSGFSVRYANPGAFLATKFQAFTDPERVKSNDYVMSHDFEDIIAVVDGRDDVVDFLQAASADLRAFVREECKKLFDVHNHEDLIAAHLRSDAANQARLPLIVERLRSISKLQ